MTRVGISSQYDSRTLHNIHTHKIHDSQDLQIVKFFALQAAIPAFQIKSGSMLSFFTSCILLVQKRLLIMGEQVRRPIVDSDCSAQIVVIPSSATEGNCWYSRAGSGLNIIQSISKHYALFWPPSYFLECCLNNVGIWF